MPNVIVREAVRALLVSEQSNELLLVRLHVPDSGKRIWLTPGGGIEVGETKAVALQREVWEETGLKVNLPGEPVWKRSHTFVFRGEHFEQHELYYFLRVPKFEPRDDQNPAAHEKELVEEMRWWTLAEIQAATDQTFVPRALGEHLESLLSGVIPSVPGEVGV